MLLFNGTWQIDIANAKTWDNAAKAYIPDEVGEEIITIRVEDGVQDYEVLYGDDPVIRMGYTARFDVAEWVPYSVRQIISAPGVDQTKAVAEFRHHVATATKLDGLCDLGHVPYMFYNPTRR
jgi:hypothetical protein